MSKFMFLGLALLAAASPAPAASDTSPESAKAKDEKVICRRNDDMDTGSHLGAARKICMTRAEWRRLDQHVQRELRSLNDKSAPTRPPTGIGSAN